MAVTLVIPQSIADSIHKIACYPDETAGVLQVAVIAADGVGDVRLLARSMAWVPESSYRRRTWNGLSITSDGYIGALSEAEAKGTTCLWVHTHPGQDASPTPSVHDHVVDEELRSVFRIRTGSSYYGALVFSANRSGLVFKGHIDHEVSGRQPIVRLWVVGDRFRLLREFGSTAPLVTAEYDRNVRAFGAAVQHTLNDLRVGVVGCGGTGSIVTEQLVRLGVRRIKLFDPDVLSESNITRVYGSGVADVGRPKVEVLRDHLHRIVPDVLCETWQSAITIEDTARQLADCDIVFGCTDDNAGRLVLSRVASYLLVPVIDCGVLLSSDPSGEMTGIDGRVTVMSPGLACLVCRGRVDLARAASELLMPKERERRINEGYAPALGRLEPAVVSFTTFVGAAAVNEMLERLVGYGTSERPSEVLLRCHEREISTNRALPRAGHYCDPESGKLGWGHCQPFLDQTWPS